MSWILYVVNLPSLISLLTLFLLVTAFGAVYWMWRQQQKIVVEFAIATRLIRDIPEISPAARRNGLDLEVWNRLEEAGAKFSWHTQKLWGDLKQNVESYSNPDGTLGYFLVRPLKDVVSSEPYTKNHYYGGFFRNLPGIVTSIGLFGTFTALFLGLMDVRPDGANGFSGIGDLVSSLAGKFVTSIVAILASIIILFFDQHVFQRKIKQAFADLLEAVENRLPYLTPSRILLDIQVLNAKQAKSLSNVSSEFIDIFKDVFIAELAPALSKGFSSGLQEEIGPTLSRVNETMQELTSTVQRLESGKQESVVGEFKSLTDALQRSIREALGEMGTQFRESLSSNTQGEFEKLAAVVQGSAGMLEAMTQGFSDMKGTLHEVIEKTKASTSDQASANVEQTQRLNLLIEGLVARLNETAQQNFNSIGAALTTVISRLSDKVTELSEDLVRKVGDAAQISHDATRGLAEETGKWSAETNDQLKRMLETLQVKTIDFERAGETLLSSQAVLERTLIRSNEALGALEQASGNVSTYTAGLTGLQKRLDEGQRAHNALATQSHEAVRELIGFIEKQKEILKEQQQVVLEYREVYSNLDDQLGETLDVILTKMRAFNEGVEKSFSAILEAANNHFPAMAGTLQDANGRLATQVDELSHEVDKVREVIVSISARK